MRRGVFFVLPSLLLIVGAAWASDPAVRCEATKLKP
jgi:hypothetical protein